MSLVGVSLCKDGIVVFADTKSSRAMPDGTWGEDKERGPVQKVFWGDGCVCAAYGTNEIFLPKKTYPVPLEEYMNDADLCEPTWFLHDIHALLLKNSRNRDLSYGFIFGVKEKDSYHVERAMIRGNSLSYTTGITECGAYYGGADIYVRLADLDQNFQPGNLGVEEYADRLKWRLRKLVEFIDTLDCYNPVGNRICVDIFR